MGVLRFEIGIKTFCFGILTFFLFTAVRKWLKVCDNTPTRGKSIASRPGTSCSDQKSPEKQTEMSDMKAEILSLSKNDIPMLLRTELKTVLVDKFNNMRS